MTPVHPVSFRKVGLLPALALLVPLGCATAKPAPQAAKSPPPPAASVPGESAGSGGDKVDGYAIELMNLTEQPAISMSGRTVPTELETQLGSVIPRLLAHALANRLQVAGPPFVRYAVRSAESVEYEAGLPVLKTGEGTDAIRPSALPAGPAATTVHVGAYEQLPVAHAALESWRVAHKRTASGPGWEVFLTNPLQEPDSSKWRTKVFLPLQP